MPPEIELGIYRVGITHDDVETPAKYNTETELGFELSPIEFDRDTADFCLKLNSGAPSARAELIEKNAESSEAHRERTGHSLCATALKSRCRK